MGLPDTSGARVYTCRIRPSAAVKEKRSAGTNPNVTGIFESLPLLLLLLLLPHHSYILEQDPFHLWLFRPAHG